MNKTVHYILGSIAPYRDQWPEGRTRCIFCGKSKEDRDPEVDEFHTVFNPEKNWEAARKYRTLCRDEDEISALWVMQE